MPDAAGTPAPIPPTVPAPAQLLRAAWKDIHRSPLNPRKRFDADALAELSESIAAEGLLQNLVVRPHPTKPNEYELIAGERRHRAYELLIKAGRAKPEDQLPVQIRKLDDKSASFIALAENVARNELTPMEEAEAFAKLVALGVGTDEIARQVGKTQRFVQKRLKLRAALTPEARKALETDAISVEQANALALAPPDLQAELLEEAKTDEEGFGGLDTEALRRAATQKLVPVGAQCFDIALYKGDFAELDGMPADPDEPTRCFRDTAQVQKLAKAELERLKADLAKKHKWVEIKKISGHGGTDLPWDWKKADKGDAKAGALVVFHVPTASVKVHAPVRKPAASPGSGGGRYVAPPPREYGWDFVRFYRAVAGSAVIEALAGSATLALRAAAFAAVGDRRQTEVRATMPALAKRAEAVFKLSNIKEPVARWKALRHLDARALTEIVVTGALLTLEVETDRNSGPGKPPALSPVDAAIAAEAKADIAKVWQFYGKQADAFLDACGPKQLARVAEDLGIALPADASEAAARSAIAKEVAKHRGYVPPWLALDTADGIAKRLKAPAPKAAKK